MSKPPKQSHIEYLLDTISKEPEPLVTRLAPIFTDVRDAFIAGELTEQQVRDGLGVLMAITLRKCQVKHRVKNILTATIDYIIDPEKKANIS